MSLERELEARLAALEEQGLARELVLAREGLADFTSNDYLGLARHPAVAAAASDAALRFGAGARASRLLGGGSPLEREAERALADWLGVEDALLFASGSLANHGALGALVEPGDALVCDELVHASLIDAARLTRARRLVHRHVDLDDVARRLAEVRGARRRFVVTEGVFSMDGDLAPLVELARLCAAHDAWLVVDEAHAVGVVGPAGAGAWAAARAAGADAARLAALVVPCGKALGAQGGFVAGSRALRRLCVARSRSLLFGTGLAPAAAGALTASIPLARAAEAERAHLRELAAHLARTTGLPTPPAAIAPLVVGENDAALAAAARLAEAGFDVRAVRPPTVPRGTARLRLVLHATNTADELDALARRLPVPIAAAPAAPVRRPLVVVGTDTDVGKTVASALLVRAAARCGPVTYWKPVQTGDDSDTDTVRALAGGTAARFLAPEHGYPLPASPHEAAADAGATIDVDALEATFAAHARATDGALLVELAGGLLVPYDDTRTQADSLARLRPRLVLVARSGLGTLNHTLLTLEALRARRLEPEALLLVGDEHPSNRETLRRMGGVAHVYEVPRFAPLDAAALDAWLDEHDLAGLFDA